MDASKRLSPILCVLLSAFFAFLILLVLALPSQLSAPGPQPLSGDDYKDQRREYIAEMHRAAPDLDWEAVDARNRWRFAQERFRLYRQMPSRSQSLEQDTLADQQLIAHWRELGSRNLSGRTRWAEYNPSNQKIYVASSGGNLWKGDLNGNGWQSLTDLYQIPNLISVDWIISMHRYRMIAVSGKSKIIPVMYSDDEGATWVQSSGLGAIATWGTADRAVIAEDPLNSIFLLAYYFDYNKWGEVMAVFRSTDHGASFSMLQDTFDVPVYGNRNNFDIWTDNYGSGEVYLLENNHCYQFNPGTQRFQLKGTLPAMSYEKLFLTGRETPTGTYLYAMYCHNSGGKKSAIYRSTDGGVSWSYRGTANGYPFQDNAFNCGLSQPDHVFLGSVNCSTSVDGGVTWTQVNSWGEYYSDPMNKLHADICGINTFRDAQGNDVVLLNTDGGTYISYDDVQTVSNLSSEGLNVSQYYTLLSEKNQYEILYAGSQDQGYQRSLQDTGQIRNFDQLISGDYGHLTSGDGGQSIWLTYPGRVYYYPDARNSSSHKTWKYSGSGYLWMAPVAAIPGEPYKAYVGGGTNTSGTTHLFLLTYQNGSITSQELSHDFDGGGNGARISAIAISPVDPNYRFVLNNQGHFFYSFDAGWSWHQSGSFSGPTGHYFYGSTIWPSRTSRDNVYIGGSGYSNPPVYVSHNHGQSFAAFDNQLPGTLVHELSGSLDDSLLFAATELGPYVYHRATSAWHPAAGLHAPDQVYWTVDYVDSLRVARFGTYGRGIWSLNLCNQGYPQAQADFSFAANNLEVNFQNLAQRSFFFDWDFGDGATSNERNPVHTYSLPGTYQVQLIAQNHCLSDTQRHSLQLTVLPVSDLTFEAEAQGREVALEWVTEEEKGLQSFEIQRSLDGVYFEGLAEVAASGWTESSRTYRYTDLSLPFGKDRLLYRLQVREENGNDFFSEVREVRLASLNWEAPRIMPNPNRGQFRVLLPAVPFGAYRVEILDIQGRTVFSQRYPAASAWVSHDIQLNKVNPGIYFLLVKDAEGLLWGDAKVQVY